MPQSSDPRRFPERTAACSLPPWREPSSVPAIRIDEHGQLLDALSVPAQHTVELSTLWAGLCARTLRGRAYFFSEGECCAVLELAPEGKPFGKPIDGMEREILERVLLGSNQKLVAMEFARSASSISAILRRTLLALGFDCTGSKLPIFVAMAAYAAHVAAAQPRRARSALVRVDGRVCLLVCVERPDRDFSGRLSSAECAVARLVVEGLTHAHIARVRGTSRRTVANQLATSFRKLRVSGRIHMLSELVTSRRSWASDLTPSASSHP